MGIWADRLLPRIIDWTLGTESINVWRRTCLHGLTGVVVEPGFGSGLNLPHLPPAVTKVYAVDPSLMGRKLAANRIADASAEVEFVGLDGQRLPLENDSCDGGLLTFTLCTIPDHVAALAELRRVIVPGGTLHFVEHGASPDATVRRLQDGLTPIQRRVADGCHLNRPIVSLIEDAGFDLNRTESAYAGRPKFGSYLTAGVATNPPFDS